MLPRPQLSVLLWPPSKTTSARELHTEVEGTLRPDPCSHPARAACPVSVFDFTWVPHVFLAGNRRTPTAAGFGFSALEARASNYYRDSALCAGPAKNKSRTPPRRPAAPRLRRVAIVFSRKIPHAGFPAEALEPWLRRLAPIRRDLPPPPTARGVRAVDGEPAP